MKELVPHGAVLTSGVLSTETLADLVEMMRDRVLDGFEDEDRSLRGMAAEASQSIASVSRELARRMSPALAEEQFVCFRIALVDTPLLERITEEVRATGTDSAALERMEQALNSRKRTE